ncbi:GreA/GreB family elongation factor [Stutzerimonas stutzeri]|uniref:GreA/GreB family elongation factor n=1 Tax=Stutzerimonas stutzeri TaxID=316 RepID=UPI000317708F|nr:GreA/GreB family elongation factor [Stutzerimonas stutzeri]
MNKTHLQTLIIEKLQDDLAVAKNALRASHEAATHSESKAENKYDTRGLEAAYLADGQRRRVHEIETALASYRNLPVRSHRNEAITLGALVSLESSDAHRWVFLGPDAAGLCVSVEGDEVLVISPRSPLGRALLGCEEGDEAEVRVEGQSIRYSVISVS